MAVPTSDAPAVMSFAGLDPTGGAGLQADIEAIASAGCHALPVATVVTVQDTRDVRRTLPLDPLTVVEQARAVLEDVPVAAFKIGVVGSAGVVAAIHSIIEERPDVPVVVDPVCASGAGTPLADDEVLDALVTLLLPRTTVVTPNSKEGPLLAPEADSPAAIAQQIMSYGCEYVLVTGTHDPTPRVVNRLYSGMREVQAFWWDRLDGEFHGSGCTLASAIAANLAHGVDPLSAVAQAQRYTWETLRHARRLGRGQRIPDRFYWVPRGLGDRS